MSSNVSILTRNPSETYAEVYIRLYMPLFIRSGGGDIGEMNPLADILGTQTAQNSQTSRTLRLRVPPECYAPDGKHKRSVRYLSFC